MCIRILILCNLSLAVALEELLLAMDQEIKNTLQKNNQDHDKCLAIMSFLESVQISGIMLRKIPQLIDTMKKVSAEKYRDSELTVGLCNMNEVFLLLWQSHENF